MTSAGDKWYVLRNEAPIGPIKFLHLQEFASRKLLYHSDWIWEPGLEHWVRAEAVPGLFIADLAREPPPLPTILAPPLLRHESLPPPLPRPHPEPCMEVPQEPSKGSDSVQEERGRNYFARHWRGELPLYVSYWFNGVVGYIAATVLVTLISATTALKNEFAPTWTLLSISSAWLITLAVVTWQIVGTWKSASTYQGQNARRYWGIISKVTLALAGLRMVGAFAFNGIPQLNEYYQIYMGDEDVGKHTFRVMRDGQELEFFGGISFGVAKEFSQFLSAMGALRTIHLNSVGGRIIEAQRIAGAIRARGLDTYVAAQCLSACTIIFLGGQNRLMAPGAQLGFHQPNFPGMTSDDRASVIAEQTHRLEQLGVSAAFAERAMTTPPKSMWFPSTEELVHEGVVTRIVDSSNYALSGLGLTDFTLANIDQILQGIKVYAAIKQIDPAAYEKMRNVFLIGLQQGQTVAALRTKIAPIADRVYMAVLSSAPSETLQEYARLTAWELNFLKQRSPKECYIYANPDKDGGMTVYDIASKYPAIEERENSFRLLLLKGYRQTQGTIQDEEYRDGGVDKVLAALRNRFGTKAGLITADEIAAGQYGDYCAVLAAFYEEIGRLPTLTAGAIIRGTLAAR